MAISKEVLDELLKDYKGSDDLTGPDGLLKRKRAIFPVMTKVQ